MSFDIALVRQRNPRLFWAACGAAALILLSILAHTQVDDPYALYGKYRSGEDNGTQGLRAIDDDLEWAPRDLDKAVRHAEKLWQRNVDKRKEFINANKGLPAMREFSDKSQRGGQSFTLWDVYVPAYPCPYEVERVGRMADGGKYTCGLSRIQATKGKKCVVYSFGVERESSWEAEILERTDCEIFMYDFSVEEFGPQLKAMDPAISSRAHFHKFGLGDKDEIVNGNQFYTLTSLMKQNGHDWIDIFKIDIEGGEFKVLPDIIVEFGNGKLPFSQMLLEIHAQYTKQPYSTAQFGEWWDSLEQAGLRAFSSELNYPAIHWNPFPTAM